MVDDKIDMLRMELEEKLMMLKVRVRGESKRERGVACALAAARARGGRSLLSSLHLSYARMLSHSPLSFPAQHKNAEQDGRHEEAGVPQDVNALPCTEKQKSPTQIFSLGDRTQFSLPGWFV